MTKAWLLLLLFPLACADNTPVGVPCGALAGGATCDVGQYCNCAAGYTSVDERDYPGCAAPANNTDPNLNLGNGAPGECTPCSSTAYCGVGRAWDEASCSCS